MDYLAVIIYLSLLIVFFYSLRQYDFYSAFIHTSLAASIGILILPNKPLVSFWINIGRWYYVTINFLFIKLILIICTVTLFYYLRSRNLYTIKEKGD